MAIPKIKDPCKKCNSHDATIVETASNVFAVRCNSCGFTTKESSAVLAALHGVKTPVEYAKLQAVTYWHERMTS